MRARSWVSVLLLVACGGRSQEPSSHAAAGAAAGGGAGAGGVAGAGGSGPACIGTPRSLCLRTCAQMGPSNARCVDGEWQCPDGVFSADCPPDSCGLSRGECCNPMTGELSGAGCGDDGRWRACEDPTRRNAARAACIPDYLGIDDCNDIDGKVCETLDHECNNAGGCRFSCRCIGTDGGMIWHCVQPAC